MKVYSPLKDINKKVRDDRFGYLIDKVKARRIVLISLALGFIALGIFVTMNLNFVDPTSSYYQIGRFVPMVIFSITALWLFVKATITLELYERGLIYKKLFMVQRYRYDKISQISEDRANMSARNHYKYRGDGISSRMNSYHVSTIYFKDGKKIKLSTPCFWKVKKKIGDFNQNLVDVTLD
ncbi:MAG: DUF6585 family protein [Coprobacillaceae bacterium]